MKRYLLFAVSVLVAISAIFYCNWDWVIRHEDLAAGFLTSIILVLALIGALLTLRAMRHDRATTIAMTLSQVYESGVIFEGRKLVRKIQLCQENRGIQDRQKSFLNTLTYYKRSYPDEFMKLSSIPALFDLIGWLVREGCCEAAAIDEQLDWEVHYTMWEPYIRQKQGKKTTETLDDKATAYYGNFVWLAKEIQSQSK